MRLPEDGKDLSSATELTVCLHSNRVCNILLLLRKKMCLISFGLVIGILFIATVISITPSGTAKTGYVLAKNLSDGKQYSVHTNIVFYFIQSNQLLSLF